MTSKARTIPCVPFLRNTGIRGFASTATAMTLAPLLPQAAGQSHLAPRSTNRITSERIGRFIPPPAKRWEGKAEAKRRPGWGAFLATPHPDAHFIRVFPPHHSLTLVGEG